MFAVSCMFLFWQRVCLLFLALQICLLLFYLHILLLLLLLLIYFNFVLWVFFVVQFGCCHQCSQLPGERLVTEIACYVLSVTINTGHSHSLTSIVYINLLLMLMLMCDRVCICEADSSHKSTDCHLSLLPYQRTFSRHFHDFVEVCLLSEPTSR